MICVMTKEFVSSHKSSEDIYSPPGSLLMWLIIFVEVLTFSMLVGLASRFRYLEPQAFQEASIHLKPFDGLVMTLSLLLSGFLAAEVVRFFFQGNSRKSLYYLGFSILSGCSFVVLKFQDFSHKVQLKLTIEVSDFWQYYWMLMAFHLMHVLVGLIILIWLFLGIYRNKIEDAEFSVRGGILFWHMCDLIWLIIFPLFYFGGSAG